jgi:uncharacterized membrane protein YobD (UPF0266 family)
MYIEISPYNIGLISVSCGYLLVRRAQSMPKYLQCTYVVIFDYRLFGRSTGSIPKQTLIYFTNIFFEIIYLFGNRHF